MWKFPAIHTVVSGSIGHKERCELTAHVDNVLCVCVHATRRDRLWLTFAPVRSHQVVEHFLSGAILDRQISPYSEKSEVKQVTWHPHSCKEVAHVCAWLHLGGPKLVSSTDLSSLTRLDPADNCLWSDLNCTKNKSQSHAHRGLITVMPDECH